ncbi:hypothetical protein OIU84_003825 [Salix udensis]|uniref:Uncharacterized protein n=1 Tax=Salix udensis TaxID=889485 RepID=A0AAD6P3A0_9ROSI|nr:hypothetical protein OIU84_003825 [Salix udensis]
MHKHIVSGNWRVVRFSIAAIIVESLSRFQLGLVRTLTTVKLMWIECARQRLGTAKLVGIEDSSRSKLVIIFQFSKSDCIMLCSQTEELTVVLDDEFPEQLRTPLHEFNSSSKAGTKGLVSFLQIQFF